MLTFPSKDIDDILASTGVISHYWHELPQSLEAPSTPVREGTRQGRYEMPMSFLVEYPSLDDNNNLASSRVQAYDEVRLTQPPGNLGEIGPGS